MWIDSNLFFNITTPSSKFAIRDPYKVQMLQQINDVIEKNKISVYLIMNLIFAVVLYWNKYRGWDLEKNLF